MKEPKLFTTSIKFTVKDNEEVLESNVKAKSALSAILVGLRQAKKTTPAIKGRKIKQFQVSVEAVGETTETEESDDIVDISHLGVEVDRQGRPLK